MALLLLKGIMETAREDHPTPQEDATPPEEWPEESAGRHEETVSSAPDGPEHQTIEEPGYGHGV
jgi:hypothetical protein